jgi:hypothetical protein
MKLALSISLGGEPISPSECNYSSYVELALICPACKNPVLLVKGGAVSPHIRKGKAISSFSRESHFSHFYEKDRLGECENRSNYSKMEIELLRSQSRQQRKAVFIGRIAEILQLSPSLRDLDVSPALVHSLISEAVNDNLKAFSIYQIVGKNFWIYLKTNWVDLRNLIKLDSFDGKIACEVLEFLISESGELITTNLFWCLYYEATKDNFIENTSKLLTQLAASFKPILA